MAHEVSANNLIKGTLFLISNNPLSPTPAKVELLRLVFVRRKHILSSSWVKSSSVSLGLLIVPVGLVKL